MNLYLVESSDIFQCPSLYSFPDSAGQNGMQWTLVFCPCRSQTFYLTLSEVTYDVWLHHSQQSMFKVLIVAECKTRTSAMHTPLPPCTNTGTLDSTGILPTHTTASFCGVAPSEKQGSYQRSVHVLASVPSSRDACQLSLIALRSCICMLSDGWKPRALSKSFSPLSKSEANHPRFCPTTQGKVQSEEMPC